MDNDPGRGIACRVGLHWFIRTATKLNPKSCASFEVRFCASILKQIGAEIDIPPPSGSMKPATFTLDNTPLI